MGAPRSGCKAVSMKIQSDTENTVRAWLLARDAELRDRIQRVQADLKREREPLPRDSAEAAVAVENDEVLEALEDAACRELTRIGRALDSLDAGTYGRCDRCGARIEPRRLAAVPHAMHCNTCERGD